MAKMAENKYVCEGLYAQLEKAYAYKENYMTTIAGREFILYPDVFNPEVFSLPTHIFDTWLHLIRRIKPGSLLEIGAGAGYFAVLAALNGANRVTATDITKQAVANIQANIDKYNLTDRMQALYGSVFEPLDENDRFDVIFWDFPITPVAKPLEELNALERTIFDPGYKFIETYIKEAHKYLTNAGRLFIMFSNKMGDSSLLLELVNKHGWRLQLIENPDCKATTMQGMFDDDIDLNFYELIKQ